VCRKGGGFVKNGLKAFESFLAAAANPQLETDAIKTFEQINELTRNLLKH
jgi:hypothetical protein